MTCPICAQPFEGGDLVIVCTPCHRALGPGALTVGATGEFRVPSAAFVEAATAAGRAPSESAGERPSAVGACAWCGKLEAQVKKLLGRAGVALCNECVGLCCDILDAELGTWR